MGGGPDEEQMLIILWEPEPKEVTNKIRTSFPYIHITYFCLSNGAKPLADMGERVPRELFKDATILVTLASLPPTPELAPNLKFIHLFSAGVDHFANHPIFKNSNITITTSSGIHGPPIAEWILMTATVATKHYNVSYELQKQHVWGKNDYHFSNVTDWVGKRVGIAGYGSIGRQVARVFTALGSTVLAYTASPRSTPEARRDHGYIVPGTGDVEGTYPTAWYSGTTKADLHAFLSQSLDALIISLPLIPSTIHLFSKEEFDILSRYNNGHSSGSGAFIVNISRGKIIDQPALIAALNDGRIRGAALDVSDPEPLPADNELWNAKNVIITPHISALGTEYMIRAYDLLITNLHRRENGEKMFNVIDRKKGY